MRKIKPNFASKPRLLFVVTEDWYFVSHRLHLAVAAIEAGYHVGLVTRISRHRELIKRCGIELFDWQISRRSHNLLREFHTIRRLIEVFRVFRPDVVHNVAIKPVLYGALAARLIGINKVVHALGGLGFVFSSSRLSAYLLRPFIKMLFLAALAGKSTRLILQNPDDRQLLLHAGVIPAERICLIRGAGVDTVRFAPSKEPAGALIIMLPARLLWDKGIGDFVQTAERFRRQGINARFVLVGGPDEDNPASVPKKQIRSWCSEGLVEWWGHRDDMPNVLSQAHVICLPTSYGEGLPKSLLEAASCARPIVTYDVPGCREVVRDGQNGFLVPLKNIDKLGEALLRLLGDPKLRRRMGANGRNLVLNEFSQEKVARETIDLYRGLLR